VVKWDNKMEIALKVGEDNMGHLCKFIYLRYLTDNKAPKPAN